MNARYTAIEPKPHKAKYLRLDPSDMDLNHLYTDLDIVEAIRKGGKAEEEAIRVLYQQHFESLCMNIVNNNGSEQDADDIFQETMIAFIQSVKMNKFRGDSSIKTFLFALNRNIWRNELRRRGRSNNRERVYEMDARDVEDGVNRSLELRQASQQLAALMEKLGENCRQILLQFYYENRSMKEIVLTLAYENEQVVRNKKSKCLKKLAEMIGGDSNLIQQLKTLLHG
jgi:RNA polymerase sigma factor (sigma-70 family)